MRWLFCAAVCINIGCSSPAPFARASQIQSMDQAVGGPSASARIGDFLLENDQIRVVIEQGQQSRLPLDYGGSVVDMDLVRPELPFRGGHGLDQLGQIAPTANLYIAQVVGQRGVRITGSSAGAEITVSAEGTGIQKVLNALGLLLKRSFIDAQYDYTKLRLYTEYELRPGERILRAKTTVGFDVPFCPVRPADGCNESCDDILYDDDCSCPTLPERCLSAFGGSPVIVRNADVLPDRPEPAGLSDILLGDLPRPVTSKPCKTNAECNAAAGEKCADITSGLGGESRVCRLSSQKSAGVFLGDMLIFGGQLSLFIPGTGFDTETDIRRLFDSGQDTLSQPLKLDAVYGIGDRVSYGYASPTGKVFVPVFGGPFSMGGVAAASCREDQPGCLQRTLVRAERWMSVGEGDPASAREPLLAARGDSVGKVSGTVRWAHSGRPISGAEVFALSDPRALACDAACLAKCGELASVDDAALAGWSVTKLIDAVRCRSVDATYLNGLAGIDTMAKTDPGTDRVADGRFQMSLRPGARVLYAQLGKNTASTLIPIRVEADGSTEVAFLINEPGRLKFALFDEQGKTSAGRITIGQCLPQNPCVSDAECASGTFCQAGSCACARSSLLPIELGAARLSDGVLAFAQTSSGVGELELPEGEYELVFSRGPHAAVDRKSVTIRSGLATNVQGVIRKVVDTRGWTSADFHVHAEPSVDSGTTMTDRITSFLAEAVDFLSSSDHDVLTRYQPLIQSLGKRSELSSQVGVEVTTQELGHFIGFPMNYQEWTASMPPLPVVSHGAPEWREKKPAEIFQAIRDASDPTIPAVVSVPHPFSYFDNYGLDPVSLEPVESTLALFNPLVEARHFSGNFDSMELMNSKGFDLIRRPTVGDVRFYTQSLDALLVRRQSGALNEADYQREVYNLSTETTRRILHRTVEEQDAALAGEGNALSCRCGSTGDCSSGLVCDPSTLSCVAPGKVTNGPLPKDVGLCRTLRGVIDDWFNMLNRGVYRPGLSGSDVHGVYGYEAGSPRTMLKTDGTAPGFVDSKQVTDFVRRGKALVTNGPFVQFTIGSASAGDSVEVERGGQVSLSLRVETAGWYDVDRIEVYRNGSLIHWMRGCASKRGDADPHGHACIRGEGEVLVFEETFADAPTEDAWYVVIASGLDGKSLAPVYASAALARFGTFEVAQRVYDIVPVLSGLRTPRFPSLYPTFPYAVTNPIWVDVGADGWKPSKPAPSWCVRGRDVGCN